MQWVSLKIGERLKEIRNTRYLTLDEAAIREKDREVQKWKKEAARAHAEAVTVRKYWGETSDDLERGRSKRQRLKQSGSSSGSLQRKRKTWNWKKN